MSTSAGAATQSYVDREIQHVCEDIKRLEDSINQLWEKMNGLATAVAVLTESNKNLQVSNSQTADDGKKLLWFMITQLVGLVFLFIKNYVGG